MADVTTPLDDDLRERRRVADQMLSGHAVLRDRYFRRARIFDIVLFSASSLLLAVTFFDPSLLGLIRVQPDAWRLATGVFAVLVFILSFIAILVDWKDRSSRHRQAAKALADVKAKARDLLAGDPAQRKADGPEFLRASAFVMSELEPIPESHFAKLKAHHRIKVEVSKMLDRYPGAPVWLLRLRLRFQDSWRAIRGRDQQRADEAAAERGADRPG